MILITYIAAVIIVVNYTCSRFGKIISHSKSISDSVIAVLANNMIFTKIEYTKEANTRHKNVDCYEHTLLNITQKIKK